MVDSYGLTKAIFSIMIGCVKCFRFTLCTKGAVPIMDDHVYMTLLFDFYGELLTDRQKEILTRAYFEDLSLSEIGEIYKISPQGVRDTLKRAEKLLRYYESKLKLLEAHLNKE